MTENSDPDKRGHKMKAVKSTEKINKYRIVFSG